LHAGYAAPPITRSKLTDDRDQEPTCVDIGGRRVETLSCAKDFTGTRSLTWPAPVRVCSQYER
jgi:hypothetical protein